MNPWQLFRKYLGKYLCQKPLGYFVGAQRFKFSAPCSRLQSLWCEKTMNKELFENLVKERPHLWWWIRDKESLSMESVVQGVLANGDMNDVLRLFEVVGKVKVKRIFLQQVSRKRHNYRPQTVNFFKKVFSQDV